MSFRGLPAYLSDLIADQIVGAVIKTAAAGARLILSSPGNASQIVGYSGNVNETAPGGMTIGQGATFGSTLTFLTQLLGPAVSTIAGPFINLQSFIPSVGAPSSTITLKANQVALGDSDSGTTYATFTGTGINLKEPTTIGPDSPVTGVINGVDRGVVNSQITDGSGNTVVSHGLGVAPTGIRVTPFTAANGRGWRVASYSAASFTINWFDTNTKASLAGANVGFFWEVCC